MKLALLGTGKTGSFVNQLHPDTTCFNSTNIPTLEKLKDHDVILSFLPATAFVSYIDLLMQLDCPVVIGSTGFEWDQKVLGLLKENKKKWIHATNFSLGVALFKTFIENINSAKSLFPAATFDIHESHHLEKIDTPSGTALSLSEWLDHPCQIHSKREGDVIGLHQLTMQADAETIKISHQVNDRSLFAKGALWACQTITHDQELDYGLTPFNQMVKKYLKI